MAEKKEVQQKYVELQIIQQQIKQMEQELQKMQMQLIEFQGVMESLDDFSTVKPGDSILAQLHPGIFLKATLADNERVQVNVGSDINVERTIPETKGLIQQQISLIEKNRDTFFMNMRQLIQQATELEQQLAKLMNHV